MTTRDPVDFFERQFRRQITESDFALNPFEQLALPHVAGSVLDLGCGLGNLSLEAVRRGCSVTAIDASASAVERMRAVAREEQLPLAALQADLGSFRIEQDYDTIVAIGLLMFFRRERALTLLRQIQERVRPGGCAIVNVLDRRHDLSGHVQSRTNTACSEKMNWSRPLQAGPCSPPGAIPFRRLRASARSLRLSSRRTRRARADRTPRPGAISSACR